jgi:DNA polymerase I-like protein with 3'-5' exonuclease and polymerase domains
MDTGYALLRKVKTEAPTDVRVLTSLPPDLEEFGKQPIAFDFETHGIDPLTGSIRSVSIANDYGCVAIDLEALTPQDKMTFTKWLVKQRLIAHNAVFDIGWIYAKTGIMPKMEACTLVLLKLLSTEGFLTQRWGLKPAMTNLLGWQDSNEADLYDWLKANKLKAKDMAQAPWDILGKYNALDSAGTWQLYKYLMDVIKQNNLEQSVLQFHQEDFVTLMELIIEQQMGGMNIDLDALAQFDIILQDQIDAKRMEFLNLPEVTEHVEYYQTVIVEELEKAEPPKHTKKGDITARYTKWVEKVEATKGRLDFNIDSTQQLQWLFYERLYYDCPIKTDKGATSVGKKAVPYLGAPGQLLKEYRELRDRRKFVTALNNVQRDGVFYPNVKPHGCLTGRCSGGISD